MNYNKLLFKYLKMNYNDILGTYLSLYYSIHHIISWQSTAHMDNKYYNSLIILSWLWVILAVSGNI